MKWCGRHIRILKGASGLALSLVLAMATGLLPAPRPALAQQVPAEVEPLPMPDSGTDVEELKALTEKVIESLTAGEGKAAAGGKNTAAGGQDFMQALQALVNKATAEGKSTEDVLQLLQEALEGRGGGSLEELLARRGMEPRALLAELVRRAEKKAAPEDAYTRALKAEGESTTVEAGTAGRAEQQATAAGKTVVVQPGDTLGTIARRVYGDAAMWRKIYEANKDRLSNPDLLYVGQKLRLP